MVTTPFFRVLLAWAVTANINPPKKGGSSNRSTDTCSHHKKTRKGDLQEDSASFNPSESEDLCAQRPLNAINWLFETLDNLHVSDHNYQHAQSLSSTTAHQLKQGTPVTPTLLVLSRHVPAVQQRYNVLELHIGNAYPPFPFNRPQVSPQM